MMVIIVALANYGHFRYIYWNATQVCAYGARALRTKPIIVGRALVAAERRQLGCAQQMNHISTVIAGGG